MFLDLLGVLEPSRCSQLDAPGALPFEPHLHQAQYKWTSFLSFIGSSLKAKGKLEAGMLSYSVNY